MKIAGDANSIARVADFMRAGFRTYLPPGARPSASAAVAIYLTLSAAVLAPDPAAAQAVGPLGGFTIASGTADGATANPAGGDIARADDIEALIRAATARALGGPDGVSDHGCLVVSLPAMSPTLAMAARPGPMPDPTDPAPDGVGHMPPGPGSSGQLAVNPADDVHNVWSDNIRDEPPSARMTPNQSVIRAVLVAARDTGLDPALLLSVAWFESRATPAAVNKHSSAFGLFQFTHVSWLEAVYRYGDRHGLANLSRAIDQAPSGAMVVKPRLRKAILRLRDDPTMSALLAAEVLKANSRELETRLNRETTIADLYFLHVLGLSGAHRFIAAVERTPSSSSLSIVPVAVAKNPGLFMSGGKTLSVREAHDRVKLALERTQAAYAGLLQTGAAATPAAARRPDAAAPGAGHPGAGHPVTAQARAARRPSPSGTSSHSAGHHAARTETVHAARHQGTEASRGPSVRSRPGSHQGLLHFLSHRAPSAEFSAESAQNGWGQRQSLKPSH